MELEYTPQEQDLVALAAYQIATSPDIQQRLRRAHLLYVIGFSMLAVGAYAVVPYPVVSVCFAALAILSLVAYPAFVRRKATPASFASRKLRALPEGLEQISEYSQSKVTWHMVHAVFEDSSHTFIAVDGTYSIVIPRERIAPDEYKAFMDSVRKYASSARPLSSQSLDPTH
jgi:hypothetical protein